MSVFGPPERRRPSDALRRLAQGASDTWTGAWSRAEVASERVTRRVDDLASSAGSACSQAWSRAWSRVAPPPPPPASVRGRALALAREVTALEAPGRPGRAARLKARVLLCGLLLGYGLLAHRLYGLQVVEHARWSEAAMRQHVRVRPVPAERGRLLVLDRGDPSWASSAGPGELAADAPGAETAPITADAGAAPPRGEDPPGRLVPAAVSLGRGSLLVEGRPDRGPEEVARFVDALAAALDPSPAGPRAGRDDEPLSDAERAFVVDRLTRGRSFYFRRRRLSAGALDRVRRARLRHVVLETDAVRVHPFGPLAAQVLGLVDAHGKGASGLEALLDGSLAGTPGVREVRVDNLRRERVTSGLRFEPARPGHDVELALDRTIQAIADRELAAVAAATSPLGAAAVVVDPRTGDVLALASWPPYDPDRLEGDFQAALRCRAITDTYEPGSTIKPLFVGTAWALGLGDPARPIDCPLVLQVPGRRKPIVDSHHVGSVDEAQVLVESSNTGAYRITARLSPEQVRRLGDGFGLGRRTGIDLPGEAPGSAGALARTDVTTVASFAQGYAVSVTPLQMAMAYAALANGGTLLRPRLVRALRDREGAVVRAWPSQAVARPLAGDVVLGPLRQALERVVGDAKGTAKRARSPRYRIAGKTGTTKLLVDGRYHDREVVASFAGFAPAEDPRLAFCVVVWGPSTANGRQWGGTVAAPAAGRIADQALRVLGAPPSPGLEAGATGGSRTAR